MKAFTWIIGICFIPLTLVFIFKDNIRRKLLPNKILVRTAGDITNTDIQINWTSEGLKDTLTIYESGHQTNIPFEGKGYNYFLIYNNADLIGHFEQFKPSATNPHTYHFVVVQKADSLMLDLHIEGPDANL